MIFRICNKLVLSLYSLTIRGGRDPHGGVNYSYAAGFKISNESTMSTHLNKTVLIPDAKTSVLLQEITHMHFHFPK